MTPTSQTWHEAKETCELMSGQLSDDTLVNRDRIKQILNDAKVNLLLAGSDIQTEGEWVWLNGDKVSDPYWRAGEPNGNTAESCLLATHDKWIDYPCCHKQKALCKITGSALYRV